MISVKEKTIYNKERRLRFIINHPNYYREYLKKWRHEKGISKRYNDGIKRGISYTKEYKKLYRREYRKIKKDSIYQYQKHYRKKNRKYLKEYLLNWRRTKGKNKKYENHQTEEYKKIHRKMYNCLKRNAGTFTIQTIQQIYEDNIKLYGTLTCYLCYKPIIFGEDSVDHKTPLSRNGTNQYENLAIAHFICNCRKHDKTEAEYREWLIKKERLI